MSAVFTPKAGALNLTGNPPQFRRVEVDSLQNLLQKISEHKERYPQKTPIFRGYFAKHKRNVLSPELELSEVFMTGLERAVRPIDLTLRLAPQLEIAITREFIRRAHHYSVVLPERLHYFEWLALMQHHGAPTCFLDWTHSVHVAAPFRAIESSLASRRHAGRLDA